MDNTIPNCLGSKHTFASNYHGDTLDDCTEFSWGTFELFNSFTPPDTKAYYIPEYLSGSDYSGSTVELSNFNCFVDMYKKQLGISFWKLYGGHGTFGVAIDWEKATEDMRETLNALDDYPLIDEDELSHLEMNLEEEAWGNYIESDFLRALRKKFDTEEDEERIDNLTSSEVYTLFRNAMEATNTYYVHESNTGPYVDIDRIVAGVTTLLLPDENQIDLPLKEE